MSAPALNPVLQQQAHTLYSDHHGWLFGWLRKKMGCTHQAADLAHDAFLQILGRPEALVDVREPRAYLTTIARRLVFESWRRRDLEQAYLAELAALPEDVAPSPEDQALVLETLLAIDRLLDGLSVKARSAFLMSQLDGMTYSEIAAELHVSASRVRQYMAQALSCCYTAALPA
ncbi:MAG: sigma-70 family RNA polymerase sigma factor [Burkholderiaceae bacterium]|uniref:sigma-70 family RNA polymerase sigma factor n=1 Tax=Herminiimonas sp. Marseille-P9896 TaxID=2742211 RepID=UPI00158EF30D|nr:MULTISPECIES: sigma-70 family RNA polymerase sigma factor [Oxalobacteraceae]MBX9800996.1 sigma-70 family RNA polymerase sigma factor [Burkholderiaceae bacterium]